MGWMAGLVGVTVAVSFSIASAQSNPPAPDRCVPLSSAIAGSTATEGRLFIKRQNGWNEVKSSWFGPDYKISDYGGEAVRFIYVAPPSDFAARQFLSIRTIAAVDLSANDNFVNLRRHHLQFDTAHIGQYQDYHLSGKASGRLYRFHTWPDGTRSDSPQDVRSSWAFQRNSPSARRRVLAISYLGNGKKSTCVPFVLGPNIATPSVDIEGEDEILVQKSFTIEVTEAKTITGSAGRTFLVSSQSSSGH